MGTIRFAQRDRLGAMNGDMQYAMLNGAKHLLLIFVLLLAGCATAATPTEAPDQVYPAAGSLESTPSPTAMPAQNGAKPTLYIPPTPNPEATFPALQITISPTPTRQPFIPSITPNCANDLKFLEDLTIPDGAQVAPGEQIDKRWLVQNSGECNWDSRYTLRLVDGPSLGAPETQALYPARSGSQAVIRMIFTAPDEPGSYQSAWKAFDPEGMAFGETIFIQIVVR